MTDYAKVNATQRVYTLPLCRYEASGFGWNVYREVTLLQFQMIAGQGSVRIVDGDERPLLNVPISHVPGFSLWGDDKRKGVLRLATHGKLKIGGDWKAVVEFFDEPTTVPDVDDPDRRPRPGRKWSEFPGEIGFRLIFV